MDLNNYAAFPDATIDPGLLWEYDLSRFDYEAMKAIVVQRVVELGFPTDWYAALNLYGKEGMAEIVRGLPWLCDKDMHFVSIFFNIPLTELTCYKRKQLRPQHWP